MKKRKFKWIITIIMCVIALLLILMIRGCESNKSDAVVASTNDITEISVISGEVNIVDTDDFFRVTEKSDTLEQSSSKDEDNTLSTFVPPESDAQELSDIADGTLLPPIYDDSDDYDNSVNTLPDDNDTTLLPPSYDDDSDDVTFAPITSDDDILSTSDSKDENTSAVEKTTSETKNPTTKRTTTTASETTASETTASETTASETTTSETTTSATTTSETTTSATTTSATTTSATTTSETTTSATTTSETTTSATTTSTTTTPATTTTTSTTTTVATKKPPSFPTATESDVVIPSTETKSTNVPGSSGDIVVPGGSSPTKPSSTTTVPTVATKKAPSFPTATSSDVVDPSNTN